MILGVVIPVPVPDLELAEARSGWRSGTGRVRNRVVAQGQTGTQSGD